MNYKKCWEKLNNRIDNALYKAKKNNTDWVSIYTLDMIKNLLQEIESEVQNEEQR